MITLLQNLRKSEKGISVLELLIYIVVAAALALAAWIGLSSLMGSGDRGAAADNVASVFKIAKANCMEAGGDTFGTAPCTDASIVSWVNADGGLTATATTVAPSSGAQNISISSSGGTLSVKSGVDRKTSASGKIQGSSTLNGNPGKILTD